MDIKTQMSWVGFLMALSAINLPANAAIAPQNDLNPISQTQSSIESRLTRISATLKTHKSQLPETSQTPINNEIAGAWGNGNGRGFVNSRPRWGDGGWRNGGWRNGGWRNGGGWLNGGGGSFLNRR